LSTTHHGLRQIRLGRAMTRCKDRSALKYADLVYDGQRCTPLREPPYADTTQETVTGDARLTRYKSNVMIIIAGWRSPHSLYRKNYVTFGADNAYNQKDALGIIDLFDLPIKIHALITGARLHNETKWRDEPGAAGPGGGHSAPYPALPTRSPAAS
jgi:argininosuccinate synthase